MNLSMGMHLSVSPDGRVLAPWKCEYSQAEVEEVEARVEVQVRIVSISTNYTVY